MAQLVFRVASDWEEVVKLRNEITKLKQELKGMDGTQSPTAFKALNTQLSASTQRMDELVSEAAKAGAVMEGDFKKKIFDASQSVNGFTEKIIAQKAVVKDVEADVKRLGDAYRTALKRNPMSANGKLAEYTSAKKALDEEKAALFGLTQQQAEARLSVKKLRDEYALYNQEGKKVTETNNGMAISWKKALAVIGGVAALKRLGSEIIRVRGEFQSMQTAIETMVGKNTAGKILPQIKELAKISPLTMTDMVGAEKMMLGFNIQAEDTIKYLKALSDISMGESSKFNSLTLAFSQMSAAGKLMGQDLNQMINAGFNPLQIISEKTGKSIATLKDEMSKGAISAEMVQQAFIDATSAGGKFYNMSENASKTINGQISMMQDAWDNALNEIGTKSEGVIMSGIQATTSLIQNYETVGKILAGLVITYGTYKAGLLVALAVEQGTTKAIWAKISATKAATVAQAAFNKVAKANPYVLLASLAIGAATAMYMFSKRATEAQEVQRRYNASKEVAIRKEEEHRQEIQRLINVASDEAEATANRNGAIEALKKSYPGIIEKYIDEEGHLTNLIQLQKELNEEQSKRKVEDNQTKLTSINDKVRNQEEYVSRMSGSKEAIKEANDVLKELQRQQKEAQSAVNADYINARLEEAKKLSDDELRKFISQWKSTSSKVTGDMIGEFSRDEVASFIKSLETLQSAREKLAKNKSYWEKQKKEAEKNLDSIASSQKKLMDAGKFKGIDPTTVNNYKDNVKKLKEAEKELKVYDSYSKQEKESEKQKKKQQKLSDELLSLRRQNQQDEINLLKDNSEKKLKQIDLNYQKELDAIKKQEREWSKEQGGTLTHEQSVEISTRYSNAEKKKDKEIADVTKEQLKAEQQAINEYLKEYGTFQQQKLAIAQEYAEKIKKAQEENGVDSAQVKLLEKERDVAIQNKETEAIKADIDWVTVFGEFGGMFNDMIKPALEEAKRYVQTDKFKNSDESSQKALIDAISQMEKSLGGAGGLNFKKLGQEVQVYQNSLRELNNAKEEESDAIDKLKNAQKDYEKALKDGTEEEKRAAQEALNIAQQNADAASTNVKAQTDIVNENQQSLSATATNLRANMDNVTEGLSKLASGGVKNAYDGLIQIGKGAGGAMEKFAKKLEDIPIIGWIVAIIDVFKDGLSNVVGGLLDAVFNAVSGILSDVLSGDLFVTLGKSLRDGIGNILDSITFGGWNSWMDKINGSNAKEVAETTERLTDSNERLKSAVDNLKDEMSKSGGWKAIDAAKQAKADQETINQQTAQILMEQMGYHGSHHSNAYYWGLGQQDYASLNKTLSDYARKNGKDASSVSSLTDMYKLTPEEMDYIRTYNIEMWEKMLDQGKYDKSEYWENYADLAGQLEEITNALKETLTQTSFDSLRDSFIDSLMDMNKSAEDFADDFQEYMMRAILNSKISDLLDEDLKAFYDKWADYQKSDSKMDDLELDELKKDWDNITRKGLELRDQAAKFTGYNNLNENSDENSGREASQKGIATASQDSVDENNGRLTVIQGHTYSINENVDRMTTGIESIANHTVNLSCLTNIDKTMQSILSMRDASLTHLSNIDRNTARLEAMEQYMYSMKQGIDTLNTKGLTLKR